MPFRIAYIWAPLHLGQTLPVGEVVLFYNSTNKLKQGDFDEN